ncbi:MAG: PIG-L family deacetylase [Anaerolineae bacterium]|nr:PIG-L family deacetylase [Anaerolineae bacterium]
MNQKSEEMRQHLPEYSQVNPYLAKKRSRHLRSVIHRLSTKLTATDINQTTIIFAPHQDDETLGCGGTILRKRAMNAPVKVVYTTDGSASNKVMPKEELAALRINEALAACDLLHVSRSDVTFLGFEDGQLNQHSDAAVEKVTDILQREQPQQLFIPYFRDEHKDHQATNQIVMTALRNLKQKPVIYEYPVWAWYRWPWIALPPGRRRKVKKISGNIGVNLHLRAELKYAVEVADVLAIKYAALAQHRSQMTQLIPHPYWKTLGDISNGEFLGCFFYTYELFYRHYG